MDKSCLRSRVDITYPRKENCSEKSKAIFNENDAQRGSIITHQVYLICTQYTLCTNFVFKATKIFKFVYLTKYNKSV